MMAELAKERPSVRILHDLVWIDVQLPLDTPERNIGLVQDFLRFTEEQGFFRVAGLGSTGSLGFSGAWRRGDAGKIIEWIRVALPGATASVETSTDDDP